MDRSPPPFFKQGPSANVRLALFAVLALAVLVFDARTQSLAALRQGIGTVLYPLQRVLLVPRDTLSAGFDYVGDINRLRTENAELRRLEAANARQLLEVEHLAQENHQLRELMGARDRAPVRSQVAEVLYDSRDPFTRRIVLDKGLQQGIVNGQPVIDSAGVVGQVTRVFPLSSELTLLTDRHIAIPVQVQRNGLRAIASGSGQGGRMELGYLSVNADLKEGDLVVTSGLDSVYPPGLPVGKILTVDRSGSGNFARILVEPVAKVDNGRVMLVLMTDTSGLPPPPPSELPESQQGKRSGTRRN